MKRKLIKLGGSVFEQLDPRFYTEWSDWIASGNQLIFMHGGGPALSEYCRQLQIDSVFKQGVRVTTKDVLLGAERVLGGEVQSKIVYRLNQQSLPAVGLTGIDGASICGQQQADVGAVGQVTQVKGKLFEALMQTGFIPVVTSLITGEEGTLNCNGDTCAVALATELAVDEFELLTDVAGIKLNGHTQKEVTIPELQAGLASAEINGGMIPKTKAIMDAAQHGIKQVRIRFGQDVNMPGTRVKEEHNERLITHLSTS